MTRKTDRRTGKIIKLGWLAALVITAWLTLLSPWGAIRHYRLSRDLERIENKNGELRDENRRLKEEIEGLTNDPAQIEEVARSRYGLLRNNELIYDFSDQ